MYVLYMRFNQPKQLWKKCECSYPEWWPHREKPKSVENVKEVSVVPKTVRIHQVSPTRCRSTSVFSFCLQFVAVYQWGWVCAALLSPSTSTTQLLPAASHLSMAAATVTATTLTPRRSVRPPAAESLVLHFFWLLSWWACCLNCWIVWTWRRIICECDRSRMLEVGWHYHAATLPRALPVASRHYICICWYC